MGAIETKRNEAYTKPRLRWVVSLSEDGGVHRAPSTFRFRRRGGAVITPNPLVGGAAEEEISLNARYSNGHPHVQASSTLFSFLSTFFGSTTSTGARQDVEEDHIPLTQLRNRIAQPSFDIEKFAMKFGYVSVYVTRWTWTVSYFPFSSSLKFNAQVEWLDEYIACVSMTERCESLP